MFYLLLVINIYVVLHGNELILFLVRNHCDTGKVNKFYM